MSFKSTAFPSAFLRALRGSGLNRYNSGQNTFRFSTSGGKIVGGDDTLREENECDITVEGVSVIEEPENEGWYSLEGGGVSGCW
jgi:hypothetical protein